MGPVALHASAAGSLQSVERERHIQGQKSTEENGAMSAKELEPVVKGLSAKQPFTREKIAVTDPGKFLGSILPYMINQKLISETQKNGKAVYQLRK